MEYFKMGIETAILMAGLSTLSAMQTMKTAKSQARGVIAEGELKAGQQAKKTRYRVAKQRVSYLQSGLSLGGSAEDVIAESFATGFEDIEAIKGSADISAKNIIGAGRASAIKSLASGFSGFATGSMGSMFSTPNITAAGVGGGFDTGGMLTTSGF